MTKWQLVEMSDGSPSSLESTSPETIEWLIGELEKQSPEIKLTRRYDAEGLLFEVYGNSIDYKLLAMVKRLLCENGWEPYAFGTDNKYSYWQFRRQIEPPVVKVRDIDRYRW